MKSMKVLSTFVFALALGVTGEIHSSLNDELTRQVIVDTFATLTVFCDGIEADFENTWTALGAVVAQLPCEQVIAITQVPYVITTSATNYCLSNDVVFSGTDGAIVINAQRVNLDLNNKKIDISGGTPTSAIHLTSGASEVTISNGFILAAVGSTTQSPILVDNGASFVAISNCIAQNGATGFNVTGCTGISLDSCYGYSQTGTAHYIVTSTNVIVQDCAASTCYSGLYILNSLAVDVGNYNARTTTNNGITLIGTSNANLTGLLVDTSKNGIVIQGPSSNVLIDGAQLFTLTGTGIAHFNFCSNQVIREAQIYIAETGISFQSSCTNNVLDDCQVYQATSYGFLLDNASNNNALINCLVNIAQYGFAITNASNNSQLLNCMVTNASIDGFLVSNLSTNNVLENCLTFSGVEGIRVTTSSSNTVLRSCEVTSPTANGITAVSNSGLSLIGCTVQAAGALAYQFQSCTEVTLWGCQSFNSTGTGIQISNGTDIDLEGCSSCANREGIYATTCNNLNILNCSTFNNTNGAGIYILSSTALNVGGSESLANNQGFKLQDCNNSSLLNSVATGNTGNGILLLTSTECQVQNNTCTSNAVGINNNPAFPTGNNQIYHNWANANTTSNFTGINPALNISAAGWALTATGFIGVLENIQV